MNLSVKCCALGRQRIHNAEMIVEERERDWRKYVLHHASSAEGIHLFELYFQVYTSLYGLQM